MEDARIVERKRGLPQIGEYTPWPEELLDRERQLRIRVKELVVEEMGGAMVVFHDPCTFEWTGRFGFSFGFSKFDDAFQVPLPGKQFRYKERELWRVLARLIGEFPWLAGDYAWDRGFGTHVVNVFIDRK